MPGTAFRSSLLPLQLALVTLAMGASELYPPERGAMLLVPLNAEAGNGMAARAIAGGAAILARGPIERTLVVRGDRARLAAELSGSGVLMLAAPEVLCGRVTAPK
jgi:hypothetical protein